MPDPSHPSVFQRLCALLEHRGVPFRIRHHAPVYTCEQAAAVRGTPLASGAKALIVKAEAEFRMIVLPADRKLSSRLLRKHKIKNLRFASAEEVLDRTSLRPGSIPPFGSLFNLTTCCDESLAKNEVINFSAGDHGISIALAFQHYLAAEAPTLGSYAEPGAPGL